MNRDVLTLSSASPDPFTSVARAQGEPDLICEKHSTAVMDLLMLVFYCKCQLGSTVLGSEDSPQAILVKSLFDCLVRNIHTSGLL